MKKIKIQKSGFRRITILLSLALLVRITSEVSAQHVNQFLNQDWSRQGVADDQDSNFTNSVFLPRISLYKVQPKDTSRSWFIRKLKKESLIVIRDSSDKFIATIDPLFCFEKAQDKNDSNKTFYKNGRGILIRGSVGKDLYFESSFMENQATFARYVDDYIQSTDTLYQGQIKYPYHVIPGQGRSKSFKQNAYDFAYSTGYVSYTPGKHFNIQVGHGKHFIGDGYRSLLLSDNSFFYPYLRITSKFWKFEYTNLYSVFMNLTDGGIATPSNVERLFLKKAGNFQYLNWNIHKKVKWGVFQGLIINNMWEPKYIKVNFSDLSPVLFTSLLTSDIDSMNNMLVGTTFMIEPIKLARIYGQFATGNHGEKSWQIGGRFSKKIQKHSFMVLTEYNVADESTYHVNGNSYSHYNQPLAHPFGSDFNEIVLRSSYSYQDLKLSFSSINANYILRGGNEFSGNNVFIPSYPGISSKSVKLSNMNLELSYLVKSPTNLNVFLGMVKRTSNSTSTSSQNTELLYFGIRTSLHNFYYDF